MLGVIATALDVFIVLALQGRGFRWVEGLVLALIGVIGACFAVELWLSRPAWGQVAAGLVPRAEILRDRHALYISVGILGATVMPHNLYLHSSIVQTRNYEDSPAGKREALRFAWIDSTQALVLAFFINAAILVLAASAFHSSGHQNVAEITDAYKLLSPLLGAAGASTLFAVALLASGQNSTLTGTLAGQIVMEGFISLRLPPVARRLVTRAVAIVPAVIVIGIRGEHGVTQLLILSQVVLSLQLSFATFPLLWLTGDRRKMGEFVNGRLTQAAGWAVCVAIAVLNAWLLWTSVAGLFG
jgi:manganese transport protein